MYKQVDDVYVHALIGELNRGDGLFKLRKHCITNHVCRDQVVATRGEYAMLGSMTLGWLQGVYGPLPGPKPDMIAIIEYTGQHEGAMIVPVHYDGTPYITECYDNVQEQEYCIWIDHIDMTYDELMLYVRSDNLIQLCD